MRCYQVSHTTIYVYANNMRYIHIAAEILRRPLKPAWIAISFHSITAPVAVVSATVKCMHHTVCTVKLKFETSSTAANDMCVRVYFPSSSSFSSIICLIHFLSCTSIYWSSNNITEIAYELWMIYGVDSHSTNHLYCTESTDGKHIISQGSHMSVLRLSWFWTHYTLHFMVRKWTPLIVCVFNTILMCFSLFVSYFRCSFSVFCNHSHRKSLIPVLKLFF